MQNELEYKEFEYDISEWDNIPLIIPWFIVFLSRHLEAVVWHCWHVSQKESVEVLKDFYDKKIEELNNRIDSVQNKSQKIEAKFDFWVADHSDELKWLDKEITNIKDLWVVGISDEMKTIVPPIPYSQELPDEEIAGSEDWESESMNVRRNFTMK